MSIITLNISVFEKKADQERIDELTLALTNQLQDFDLEYIKHLSNENPPIGAKGDPVTVGAFVLGVTVVTLPALIAFLQHWVVDRRKVNIEAPNGVKVEFVPEKKYSKEDILALVKDLNKIS